MGGGAPILTAANACQYIVPADPSTIAHEATVNANAFFTFNDWQFNPGNGKLDLDPAQSSGTWSIVGVNFTALRLHPRVQGRGRNQPERVQVERTLFIGWVEHAVL
ncbi:hypothetical protein [Elioraea tepidiphila]|uniref:hypothetical protein n=1 Tax=Elioraea tepidiphila TaxID=457934 RepID=UPI00138AFC87|nr:hypothetical protein [Elioraea tepidiphila]